MKTYVRIRTTRGVHIRACCSVTLWRLSVIAAASLLSAGMAQPSLLTTLTNPAPVSLDNFGESVALADNGLILIGAPGDDTGATDAGAAYLFDSNGTLLTTYTNPSPADYENFGGAVAFPGNDLVVIGAPADNLAAPYAGAVYVYDTSGTLQTTVTNPSPSAYDQFGSALAALDSDKIIIGAHKETTAAVWNGAAYLYNTSGTLLTTITNPVSGILADDFFGFAVAGVGSDRILVGAYQDETLWGADNAGVAYLFDTSAPYANLVMTFTNPATGPSSGYNDQFGWSVAAVGEDMVIIGSPQDDSGGSSSVANRGAEHLYHIDGTLLTSVTNITTDVAKLGSTVAGVGSDRFLVGAPNEQAGSGLWIGAAYLISTNGTVLNTITNPTPANGESFGASISVKSGLALIGAYRDDAGAADAGAAYLFGLGGIGSAPVLSIILSGTDEITVAWTPETPGYMLQEHSILASNDWSTSSSGTTNPAVIPVTEPEMFYRLWRP